MSRLIDRVMPDKRTLSFSLLPVLIAGLLSAACILTAYFAVQPNRDWGYPGFNRTGIARLASWDAQENIVVAQGHSVGAETSDRMHRLVPLALMWILSGGRPNAWTALAIAFLGNLLLAYAVAGFLPSRKWLAGFVVLLPPLVHATTDLLPITLGVALGLIGWRKNNPLLLALAGFTHDTLLVFALVRRRLRIVITFLLWSVVTILIWGSNPGNFSPFGILRYWRDGAPLHFTMLALTVGMAFFAFRESKQITLLFLAYMCIMGPGQVWYWSDFTRILAPLWVLGFVALVKLEAAETNQHRRRTWSALPQPNSDPL